MSKFLKSLSLGAAVLLLGVPAVAQDFGLGRTALPQEIAAWDLDVNPEGTGLPDGSGDVLTGEEVFAQKCASCHGDFAEGIGNWPKLAGGMGTLDRDDPLKTIGSYWPYLSTSFDYIRRSMPYGNAGTLSDDDVYAIVAYILYSNDLVDDDFELSKETFLDVEMPNLDGFFMDDRIETEFAKWVGDPCMSDCKDKVEITMRALVLDVTPKEASAEAEAAVSPEPTAVAAEEETVAEPEVATLDPALVAEGEKVFRKCQACHQVGEDAKNRVGPVLNDVVGAPAGHIDGFRYSKALIDRAEQGLIWDAAALAGFLGDPRGFLKGTKMGFAGLRKDDEIEAVIAYLQSVSQE